MNTAGARLEEAEFMDSGLRRNDGQKALSRAFAASYSRISSAT